MTIIPAIDIIGGQCVRLTQGDYAQQQTYYKDPLDAALRYVDAGVTRLHMVDLDGAKQSYPANLTVLERVAARTGLDIQWGGGVKSREALDAVLQAGARRAICGSVAITAPEEFRAWLRELGGEKVILGADTKGGYVATHGWLSASEVTVDQIIAEFLPDGLAQAVVTDIAQDGMLRGPSFDLYERLYKAFPGLDITVSGGVSSAADIEKLAAMGATSVIVGKAIYEGRISFEELKNLIQAC